MILRRRLLPSSRVLLVVSVVLLFVVVNDDRFLSRMRKSDIKKHVSFSKSIVSATTEILLTKARYTNFTSIKELRCLPPSLKPYHEDYSAYKRDARPIVCTSGTVKSAMLIDGIAFKLKNGRYLHQLEDVGVPCCYKRITWTPDSDAIKLSSKCNPITSNVTEIPSDYEFISVGCRDPVKNAYKYLDAFSIIHPRPSDPPATSKLSVMVIGMDASSQLNLIRAMPRSYNFLIQNLSGILLNGYNIAGECTHTNLMPLLTGKSAPKFRKSCEKKQQNKSMKLDSCGLIWNHFTHNGYLTSFIEDYAQWGPINYYYAHPFSHRPTNYYFRPVALYLWTLVHKYYKQDYSCLGPKYSFQVLIDNLKEVAVTNKDRPLFQFAYSGGLGYERMGDQNHGDEVLLETLQELSQTNVLNNTALVIFGDHGFRKMGYRNTKRGGIEMRMPAGLIVLPNWFRDMYPELYSNLVNNSEKTTSHFDMHKTIRDIAHLNLNGQAETVLGNYTGPGISLFRPIPDDRSCLSAGIPLLWCIPCHNPTDVDEDISKEVAEFLITVIRKGKGKQVCNPEDFATRDDYRLKEVIKSQMWDRRDVVRELCSSGGEGVTLPGYFGQKKVTLNIPCGVNGKFEVDVVQLEVQTVLYESFLGEVVRYRNVSDGKIYMHLTEELQNSA